MRQEQIDHNATVDIGRGTTAKVIGQLMAQIVNEIKPDKVMHLQIKLEMPEQYEGDPAEIDDWIWLMETYFTLMNVTDLNQTIMITLQQIVKGKGNWVGAWLAVKLKEWVEMEKEFTLKKVEGMMPEHMLMLELWNIWQGDVSNHVCILRMVPLSQRSKNTYGGINGSSKPNILQKTSKP